MAIIFDTKKQKEFLSTLDSLINNDKFKTWEIKIVDKEKRYFHIGKSEKSEYQWGDAYFICKTDQGTLDPKTKKTIYQVSFYLKVVDKKNLLNQERYGMFHSRFTEMLIKCPDLIVFFDFLYTTSSPDSLDDKLQKN